MLRYILTHRAAPLGYNDAQAFAHRAKVSAYLKVQLTQDKAGSSTAEKLSWAGLYDLIDEAQDDISSRTFADPEDSSHPVTNVPLPGGTGSFKVTLAATVGGAKHSTFMDIVKGVVSIASGSPFQALFPIPSATLGLVTQVESLVNLAINTFSPATRMQYWMNASPRTLVVASGAAASDRSIRLPAGSSYLVVAPVGDNSAISTALLAIADKHAVEVDPNSGQLLARDGNGAVVSPSPFADILYTTLYATVTASAKAVK